jgi:hypothetical protein
VLKILKGKRVEMLNFLFVKNMGTLGSNVFLGLKNMKFEHTNPSPKM